MNTPVIVSVLVVIAVFATTWFIMATKSALDKMFRTWVLETSDEFEWNDDPYAYITTPDKRFLNFITAWLWVLNNIPDVREQSRCINEMIITHRVNGKWYQFSVPSHVAYLPVSPRVDRLLKYQPNEYTCITCEKHTTCENAWDEYNLNGDCLNK